MSPYEITMAGLALTFVANAYFAGSTMDHLARCAAPPSHEAWRVAYAHVAIASLAAVALLMVYIAARW